MIRESIDKIETDEFKKYHVDWLQESYSDCLQSALKLLQSGRLLEWCIQYTSTEELDNNLEQNEYDSENSLVKQHILSIESFDEEYHLLTEQELNQLSEDDGRADKETIEIIITLLCYPKYQEWIEDPNLVSENIAKYSN